MMDRLEEWRLFVAVARLGSFVRAAEQQRCSPQAVTRAIAALEARLDSRLLHRTTRSVSLSDEGQRYLERAGRALAELEQLETPVDHDAPLRGTLAITAPILFGQSHVVPIVARFLAEHRELDLRLLLLDRVVSLADESIDLGVRIGDLPDSSLRARRVGAVRRIACASPSYLEARGTPRNPAALAQHDCISFTATSSVAERWTFGARNKKSQQRISVRSRLVVNTAEAAIAAAVSGTGVVRVFSYQVDALIKTGKLTRVLKSFEAEPVPVHLVQLAGMPSRAATAFAELAAGMLSRQLPAA